MSINKEELKMIASQPVAEHEFMVDDLDGLNMLRSTLVSRLCPGGQSLSSHPLPRYKQDTVHRICCNYPNAILR